MSSPKLMLILVLFLAFPVLAFAGPLPDTGQFKCYDNKEEILCPPPNEDFYGQDAHYISTPRSFTKLDAQGNDLPETSPSWVMVRDNVTRLIWEVKHNSDRVKNYGNPHDPDNYYTWYNSDSETNGGDAGAPGDDTDTEDFIHALNAEHFGGYSDWRLPSLKELSTLVNAVTIFRLLISDGFQIQRMNIIGRRPLTLAMWTQRDR